jgi:hypothetical protein
MSRTAMPVTYTNAPAAADNTCMLQITRNDSGVEKKGRRVEPKKPMFAPRTYPAYSNTAYTAIRKLYGDVNDLMMSLTQIASV